MFVLQNYSSVNSISPLNLNREKMYKAPYQANWNSITTIIFWKAIENVLFILFIFIFALFLFFNITYFIVVRDSEKKEETSVFEIKQYFKSCNKNQPSLTYFVLMSGLSLLKVSKYISTFDQYNDMEFIERNRLFSLMAYIKIWTGFIYIRILNFLKFKQYA